MELLIRESSYDNAVIKYGKKVVDDAISLLKVAEENQKKEAD